MILSSQHAFNSLKKYSLENRYSDFLSIFSQKYPSTYSLSFRSGLILYVGISSILNNKNNTLFIISQRLTGLSSKFTSEAFNKVRQFSGVRCKFSTSKSVTTLVVTKSSSPICFALL